MPNVRLATGLYVRLIVLGVVALASGASTPAQQRVHISRFDDGVTTGWSIPRISTDPWTGSAVLLGRFTNEPVELTLHLPVHTEVTDEFRLLVNGCGGAPPPMGPVTAARFVAALDDVDRFPNAASVASYLGLIPGENTTGSRTKRTRLTRAGAPQVRWALGQAAWSLYIHRSNDPMVQWAKQVAERRGAQVAVMGLARKLAHVLYALWKHGTTYDPARGARPIAA